MARFTVTLHGVPIATVELPSDRAWAGGHLTPLPGFGQVAPLVEAAAEAPSVAAALLDLPSGDLLPTGTTDLLPAHVADAYQALALLPFGLLDEAGLPAGAELVRLAPTGRNPRVVVRVYFRHAPSSVGAAIAPPPRRGGGGADPPGA